MTIPRLELTAAALLTRLAGYVRRTMDLHSAPLWLWTDSSVALTWITSHPSKWKDFVRNCVTFIQENLSSARWRFIAGKQNPADCPEWLFLPSDQWPHGICSLSLVPASEVRSAKVNHCSQIELEPELLHRYSNLNRLLRITSWWMKFINRSRRIMDDDPPALLTNHNLHASLLIWVRISQRIAFSNELKLLQKKQPITSSSSLRLLTPFLDQNGLIRVGGRLEQSSLDYYSRHPYILSKDSTLSLLIIQSAHLRSLHSGTSNTLAAVRQKFWILGARLAVRKVILKCVICARQRAKRAEQQMGQLPAARTTPSRPFCHSGVDYAGPFLVKTWHGRAAKTYKGFVVLFICSSTYAIHLEIVTDYSTSGFIAAYKRFTGCRGICATLSSDCGTNLVGADAELKRLFTESSTQLKTLRSLLANDGTHWHFNPPSAPHFGGRWEAGVKSVKHHLKRVIGNTLLTYEEFTTVLIQIEAVLNSRPLCRLTDDPDDLAVLTPGHCLTGGPLTTIPEPALTHLKITHLSRWQLTRQILENFWTKWSREYLQQLQAIYKWQYPANQINIGSIVLIVDERYPASKWPLAKVIQLHPGADNLTRVVTLKTATTVLKRPIVKLCVLPISDTT
ncbi:uncharacterized protein LOC123302893 [Chrysoperla carnea]|uniref:uncharacterized protein LOC123302893 n=1 Tax=Chrysoperla carnea TaxID=189513 RepID=UPI001D097CB7|nr:uncharacterized protein LOC123302893 [Chrysoperla carnea]